MLIKCSMLLALTLLGGCDTQRENTPPIAGSSESLDIALRNIINDTILPAVESFKAEADGLHDQAVEACMGTLNQTKLLDLQARWKSLSLRWNALALYNFGPLHDDLIFPKINFIESMRQRGTRYTRSVRDNLSAALSLDTALDSDYFNGLTFNKVGMLPLEILLFEASDEQHSRAVSDIANDYNTHTRKCDYLVGMSALLTRHAAYVQQGWTVAYRDQNEPFSVLFLRGELDDGAPSIPTLIIAVQEHLDYLKKRKLDGLLDAELSGLFYENIAAAIDAIDVLLEGTQPQNLSLFDHMNSNEFTAETAIVRAHITAAKQAAVDQDRVALSAAIGALDGNFKREISDSLSVELGINFTDGD